MGVTTFSSPSKVVSAHLRRHELNSQRQGCAQRQCCAQSKLFTTPRPVRARRQAAGNVQCTAVSETQAVQTKAVPGLQLSIAAHEIPHPAKASYGGEDAYFVSEQHGFAFGVADGVGGWANSGINPAEYSKTLMAEAKKHLESIIIPSPPQEAITAETQSSSLDSSSTESTTTTTPTTAQQAEPAKPESSSSASSSLESSSSSVSQFETVASTSSSELSPAEADWANFTPQRAIAAAHKATKQPGSATACVLQLRPGSSILTAANLGDSGFAIFRQGQLAFQTSPLQHFFDCPYQLASCPDFTQDTDRAEDASVHQLQLESDDVIVVATDGLWDNLDTKQLLPFLPKSAQDVQQAAANIANAASRNAHDESYSSPYTKEALKQGMDIPWWEKVLGTKMKDGKPQLGKLEGGKIDDITVIVAYVGKS